MSERIEEIRERIEGCIRARYNQSEGDPEVVGECERARDDLRALEEVAEAARERVADWHDSAPSTGPASYCGAKLCRAVAKLEEREVDDGR